MAKQTLTIVSAFRELDGIITNLRDGIIDVPLASTQIQILNGRCKVEGLPLSIIIDEEDLRETGISPAAENTSFQESYVEPPPSESY